MILPTIIIVVAVSLMLFGAWIQWRASWYQMDAEEDMKDKKATRHQAARRMLIIRWGGCFYTIAGIVLLAAGLIFSSQ